MPRFSNKFPPSLKKELNLKSHIGGKCNDRSSPNHPLGDEGLPLLCKTFFITTPTHRSARKNADKRASSLLSANLSPTLAQRNMKRRQAINNSCKFYEYPFLGKPHVIIHKNFSIIADEVNRFEKYPVRGKKMIKSYCVCGILREYGHLVD
ncbi:hypothetical protein CDAR_618281 [Caerostris darwini]|uniref:Uncharacterized protein n=1 Tax=Caerostris darwini TaxID=1538125 RepID=A0AAV4SSD4_9ARAC|nr:hypothetical protein CDAR_618281 [Caerostris darwini]